MPVVGRAADTPTSPKAKTPKEAAQGTATTATRKAVGHQDDQTVTEVEKGIKADSRLQKADTAVSTRASRQSKARPAPGWNSRLRSRTG